MGDVTAGGVLPLIEKYYGQLVPQPVQKYQGELEPQQTKERQATFPLSIAVEKLFVAYRVQGVNHRDTSRVEILNNLLAHSNSSILYRALVDGGVAASVDGFHDSHRDGGLLVVVVSMQKGRRADEAIKILDRAVEFLKAGRFTEEQIKTARTQYKFEFFDDLESNFAKAKHLGFFQTIAGYWSRGRDVVNQLEDVKKSEIVEAAKQYLARSNRVVLRGVPKGNSK